MQLCTHAHTHSHMYVHMYMQSKRLSCNPYPVQHLKPVVNAYQIEFVLPIVNSLRVCDKCEVHVKYKLNCQPIWHYRSTKSSQPMSLWLSSQSGKQIYNPKLMGKTGKKYRENARRKTIWDANFCGTCLFGWNVFTAQVIRGIKSS